VANEDFVFTDKAQYNPATVEVGFNPVQAADITPLLEKNRDILSDNFKRHQEAEERNIERDNEAKRLADDANATRLMEFSDKLTGLIKTGLDIHKKKVTAELEIWALNNRDELLQSYANKNELESKALAGASLAQGLSADAEAKGASSPVIKKLEDLGGWRKVVVNRVLLQKAGIDYPNFRASAEAKEIQLPRLDEKGKPTGEHYTIVSAVGPAENAAILKAIQTAYVGKYAGMGTLADRHELLWKKIEEHEDSITAANGLEAQKQLDEERKTYINNQILVSANHSPEQFGKKLQELVTLYSQRFNGPKGAASKFMIAFKKAIEDGKIPHDTARVLLEKTTMLDNSSGKTVLVKDHPMFKNLIKENDIDTVIQNARGKEHQKKALKIQNDSEELKKEMVEVEIPKIVKEKGHITESDLLTLELAWIKDPRGGGAGIEFPLKNYATVQDQDDKAAMALAERFKELNRGFITKLQASRLPEHIRKKYEDAGVIKDNLTASNAHLSLAEKKAHALAKDYYQGYDPGAPTDTELTYLTQAKLAYEQEYARLRGLNLDEQQAHDGAIQHLTDNSQSYAIKPPRGSTTAALTKLYNVGEALKKNVNTDGHTDFTIKIEGLEHEIAELDKIALAGGGKLPAIFHNATRDYKMPGWQNAAWALARAQYKAYTGKDLIAPDGVSLNSAAAQERKLLNHKNTNAGTNRVIIQTGDNKASVEKEGGIAKETSEMTQNDFLSMIEGPYKDTPLSNYFYDNKLGGKPYTLGDVVFAKNDNNQLASAGQYGLSASQITEGAKQLGLDLKTTEFTLEVERQIFLNRLNNKLRHNNNKYAGLTERFPALSILNTEQLKQWDTIVDSEDNSKVAKGPFNKSSNVLPNLINIK
tara:strand:- start:681 stop:3305 length:2625 start_codon:yes stop_codon:yes gene_type:complete